MDFTNFKFSIATQAEIKDRKRYTSIVLREKDSIKTTKPKNRDIPRELFKYLIFIHESPGMSSTQRDQAHGISGAKGTRLRKQLMELELIRESKVNQGRGRPISDTRLTQKGEKYLKIK